MKLTLLVRSINLNCQFRVSYPVPRFIPSSAFYPQIPRFIPNSAFHTRFRIPFPHSGSAFYPYPFLATTWFSWLLFKDICLLYYLITSLPPPGCCLRTFIYYIVFLTATRPGHSSNTEDRKVPSKFFSYDYLLLLN